MATPIPIEGLVHMFGSSECLYASSVFLGRLLWRDFRGLDSCVREFLYLSKNFDMSVETFVVLPDHVSSIEFAGVLSRVFLAVQRLSSSR